MFFLFDLGSLTDWIQAIASVVSAAGIYFTYRALKVQIQANNWQIQKDIVEKRPLFKLVNKNIYSITLPALDLELVNIGADAYEVIIKIIDLETKVQYSSHYYIIKSNEIALVKLFDYHFKSEKKIYINFNDSFNNIYSQVISHSFYNESQMGFILSDIIKGKISSLE